KEPSRRSQEGGDTGSGNVYPLSLVTRHLFLCPFQATHSGAALMHQTRLVSLVEAAINTVIGFAVSFAVWPFAAWITGIEYSSAQHWAVIAIFTIASVARGYVIRR